MNEQKTPKKAYHSLSMQSIIPIFEENLTCALFLAHNPEKIIPISHIA